MTKMSFLAIVHVVGRCLPNTIMNCNRHINQPSILLTRFIRSIIPICITVHYLIRRTTTTISTSMTGAAAAKDTPRDSVKISVPPAR